MEPDLVRLAVVVVGARRVGEALHGAIRVLASSAPGAAWAVLDRHGPGRYGAAASSGLGLQPVAALLRRLCGDAATLDVTDLPAGSAPLLEPRFHVIPEEAEGPPRSPDFVLAAWPRPGCAPPATDGLRSAARLIAGAVRSARLLESLLERSSRDPLTGILNRRGILEVLDRERSRARRHGRPLSIVFLDLDRFKEVNDRLGHAIGDEVLVGIASTLSRALRASDAIGRIGGDEFLVVLPDADVGAARRTARRLARVVAAERIETSAGSLRQTFSTGAAGLGDGEAVEAVLTRADVRMLRRKRRRPRAPRPSLRAVEVPRVGALVARSG